MKEERNERRLYFSKTRHLEGDREADMERERGSTFMCEIMHVRPAVWLRFGRGIVELILGSFAHTYLSLLQSHKRTQAFCLGNDPRMHGRR